MTHWILQFFLGLAEFLGFLIFIAAVSYCIGAFTTIGRNDRANRKED